MLTISNFAADLLLADGGAAAAPPSPLATWYPVIMGILILFYFMIIRPQRKQESKAKLAVDSLKKNDRVVTIGGIHGTVTNIQTEPDNIITIRVDESTNTKLRVTRSAIARILGDEPSTEEPPKTL